MPVSTTVPAPTRPVSPARTAFPPAGGSPLNPQNSRRPSPQSLKTLSSSNNHTHLSNLDRVLLKKAPPPPQPQLTRTSGKDTDASNSIGHGSGGCEGLFNALNLSSILPSLRKPGTEAMSPKSLTRLQRLLSSPRPSPRNSIASRWRQFHGSDDWTNLLDPLDENLRRELIRYGDLVQAAYHAFYSNPAVSPSRHRHVVLPDRNYRVTKSLFATSSVDLPKWLDGLAPWMTQRSSWIGYVAVCDNEREIHRMGRRDIVIALRGTATCLEWAENFRAGLVSMLSMDSTEVAGDKPKPKVANGFYSLYKTPGPQVPSLSATVVEEVRRLMELYKGEELSITVTGHSLGAALALFVADELSTCLPQVPPVAVFSFGGPRVGNKGFADRMEGKGVKVLRVVNANDVITRVPGVLPREELGRRLGESWSSHVLKGVDGYVHLGKELRVDSRASPYLKPHADPACCHDLESYLHLVDGFMGTGCPFRSDAKRSLVRLLDQQRPNVKELYVSQARTLGIDRFERAIVESPSHVTG